MFQPIPEEREIGESQKPLAFTGQGVAMLSRVLNSEQAIRVSI
jgi:hypothetical protein